MNAIPSAPDRTMNRLQTEVRRLFAVEPDGVRDGTAGPQAVDAALPVRALVLQVMKPAGWGVLSKVWQGVQADLGLPAPAIAVAGQGGFQLWFSIATPVSAAAGRAFLETLRWRYLADVPAARIGMGAGIVPVVGDTLPPQLRHAALVPAPLSPGGPWSAFVSADLAPVFADEPWLDAPPGDAGQADLLSRLACVPLADFDRVLDNPTDAAPAAGPAPVPGQAVGPAPAPARAPAPAPAPAPALARAVAATAGLDPRGFLLGVMNDPGVDLALRIEAAKALLAHGDGP